MVRGEIKVTQDRGDVTRVVDDDVHLSGVEEISEGSAACTALEENAGAGTQGNILEGTIALITIENLALAIRRAILIVINLGIDMAICDEDIGPAVVVEINEARAPANISRIHSD